MFPSIFLYFFRQNFCLPTCHTHLNPTPKSWPLPSPRISLSFFLISYLSRVSYFHLSRFSYFRSDVFFPRGSLRPQPGRKDAFRAWHIGIDAHLFIISSPFAVVGQRRAPVSIALAAGIEMEDVVVAVLAVVDVWFCPADGASLAVAMAMSMTGTNFTVTDTATGALVLRVGGVLFSLHRSCVLVDADRRPVLFWRGLIRFASRSGSISQRVDPKPTRRPNELLFSFTKGTAPSSISLIHWLACCFSFSIQL